MDDAAEPHVDQSIQLGGRAYGPDSRCRLTESRDPSADGARAAVETFYHALNGQHGESLRRVWADVPLVQLDNPVGGILRGGDAVAELYERIFAGPVRLEVTFDDFVEYFGPNHAVFAGTETGSYTVADAAPVELHIRTTRYFRYQDGQWQQFHHHGSIDDPTGLRAYQRAVAEQC